MLVRAILVFLLVGCVACVVAASQGRKLLQVDSEGAALTGIMNYITYLDKKCPSDTAKAQGNCLKTKEQFCGTRETSEVLCYGGTAEFRSASRYTRVPYVRCSLSSPTCRTFGLTRNAADEADIDPKSLALWWEYTSKCTNANYGTSKASASTCAELSGKHCSRPDVNCSKYYAEFYDTRNLKAKRVIFRGDYNKGLLFFVKEATANAMANAKGNTAGDNGKRAETQSSSVGSMVNQPVAGIRQFSSSG